MLFCEYDREEERKANRICQDYPKPVDCVDPSDYPITPLEVTVVVDAIVDLCLEDDIESWIRLAGNVKGAPTNTGKSSGG